MISEPAADPGTVDTDNPWPGLAAFREVDRDLFYGRETETQEILRLVLRERLTVLFGLSGLGKTSLLRAGLFRPLRQENVLPVYVRLDLSEGERLTLTDQVRQAIIREATEASIEAPAFPASETLWESLHRQGAELWSPRNRIVTPLLVFDQFEEVFTLGRQNSVRAEKTEAFLTELADLCEGSVPASVREQLEANPAAAREFSFTRHHYKILLSLREDFLPELESLRGRIRLIAHNRFRLRRMNGENALRVITKAGSHLVEPDVPERVVCFVAGRESGNMPPLAELDIEPTLLSIVCRELNNKRRSQALPRITADLVQGNRDEILTEFYDRSVEDFGLGMRSFIEERLLTKSGLRDTVALENAVEMPGITREALNKLIDRRLLRIEDHGGMQRVELSHDVLTGVIRKSRDRRLELLDMFSPFTLIRDWEGLVKHIDRMPDHLRNLAFVRKQKAEAQALMRSSPEPMGGPLRPICFMVMPFGTKDTLAPPEKRAPAQVDFNALWEKAYAPAIRDLGYDPVREDMDSGALFLYELIERLAVSDLVVADLTLPNAYVYYALGIRHAAKETGCVLASADWSPPLLSMNQMRRITFPIPDPVVTEETAILIQEALRTGILALRDGQTPPYTILPKFPVHDIKKEKSSQDLMQKLAAFQAELAAVRRMPSPERADKARNLVQHYLLNAPIPSFAALELLYLLRDCTGDWKAVVEYIDQLPEIFRRFPAVQEQRALGLAKMGLP